MKKSLIMSRNILSLVVLSNIFIHSHASQTGPEPPSTINVNSEWRKDNIARNRRAPPGSPTDTRTDASPPSINIPSVDSTPASTQTQSWMPATTPSRTQTTRPATVLARPAVQQQQRPRPQMQWNSWGDDEGQEFWDQGPRGRPPPPPPPPWRGPGPWRRPPPPWHRWGPPPRHRWGDWPPPPPWK